MWYHVNWERKMNETLGLLKKLRLTLRPYSVKLSLINNNFKEFQSYIQINTMWSKVRCNLYKLRMMKANDL